MTQVVQKRERKSLKTTTAAHSLHKKSFNERVESEQRERERKRRRTQREREKLSHFCELAKLNWSIVSTWNPPTTIV
jgi:hypothetical protein